MLFDLKHDQHNQHCQHCRGAQLSHKFSKIPQLEVKLRIYFAIKLHQILNIVIFINEIIIIKLRLPPNKYPQNGCLLMWIIGVKRWTLRMKGRDWEQTSKHSSPQLLKVSPSKSLSPQGSIAIFLAVLAAQGLGNSLTQWCDCVGFKAFRPSRPNQNIAKLMVVILKHDLTNKNTTTKTNTKTNTMTNTKTNTKTNAKTKTKTTTFREYLPRAIFETFEEDSLESKVLA